MISTLKSMAQERLKTTSSRDLSASNAESAMLNKIVDNLNQKGQTAVTFGVMMESIGKQLIATSVRQELQVMTNSKALMRDRQKLDKVDQGIADTLFEMGQAGVFISNVSGYRQRISDVFKKYGKQEEAFLQVSGDPSTSASAIITALWHINQAYKRFLASSNTDGFDAFNKQYADKLGITLTEINYTKLVEEYECTRGFNKCDTTYKKFSQNMSTIGKGAQVQTKRATDKIKKALARLKCAFAKQNDIKCQQINFTDYQNNLLRNLHGMYGPQANKEGSSALANSMKNVGDALKTQVNDVKNFYIKNNNQQSYIAVPKTALLDVNSPDIATQNKADDLYTNLMTTINDTMKNSKDNREHYVFADPKVVTRDIPKVSILVHNSINTIGQADKPKTITQSLGRACENQCSNL